MNCKDRGYLRVSFQLESLGSIGFTFVTKSIQSKDIYRIGTKEDLLGFMEDKT